MAQNWYFFFQQQSKESSWQLAVAGDRQAVRSKSPAFMTVLDLSTVPDDNDWTKVRYRGPFYADFDADGDIELACEQFKTFLGKLHAELDFDISQARMYASGGKGFHIEVPWECFIPKPSAQGYPWLAYVYREMAQSLIVDTLDLNVYTGKRGRQWRTVNVLRDNGNYKVPLTVEEALSMSPELYEELVTAPRPEPVPCPPVLNSQFAMLFDRSREKITKSMAGKKKRQEKANALLDPWKAANRTPPSIERVMNGQDLREGAGFQAIAMQLSIYATTVGMDQADFLARCQGLTENHVSDSRRYNTERKRKDELSRMYQYMQENTFYDFEAGPMARLLKEGTPTPDLGVLDTEDRDDAAAKGTGADTALEADTEDGDTPVEEVVNLNVHKKLRRGFFMNGDGMFRKSGEEYESICRATLRKVEAFFDVIKGDFLGYEFDLVVSGRKRGRHMLAAEAFMTAQSLRRFFTAHQLSFQGSDSDAAALMDIMSEKSERGGRVYTYPREGFFILNNPTLDTTAPVKVYLTKEKYILSLPEDDPNYFTLKYRPTQVTSTYNIDIHNAPELSEDMADVIDDLFRFNKPVVVADMLGWFVASHYHAIYLRLFSQFPLLQVYGEAGSGKTQTVMLLAHMHWCLPELVSVKSAMSGTNFAIDAHASSSHSAPFILDEYKPRELRMHKGKLEKIKDVLKASYVGSDIGERGTVNKGAENSLGIIKSKATAPVVFMGEAIEMETAIIERSVCVPFSQSSHTPDRAQAFTNLKENHEVISAIGRALVEAGFSINLQAMRNEIKAILAEIESRLPPMTDPARKRIPARMVYNRAVVTHGLRILGRILAARFGSRYDAQIQALLNAREADEGDDSRALKVHSMSEISKVMARLALMSRDVDTPHEMRPGKEYFLGEGFVEVKVERAYDQYRRFCANVRDTPLFDTLDAFLQALYQYHPVVDRTCADSPLREDDSTERVFRFNLGALKREGVHAFR